MTEIISLKIAGHCEQVLKSLHQLQQTGQYCDVSVEGKDCLAHMHHVVLIANGAFCQKETISNSGKIILNCKKYCLQVIEAMILFLYTGEIKIIKKFSDSLSKLFDDLNLSSASTLLNLDQKENSNSYEKCSLFNVDFEHIEESTISVTPSIFECNSEIGYTVPKVTRNVHSADKALFKGNAGEIIEEVSYSQSDTLTVSDGSHPYLKICGSSQHHEDGKHYNTVVKEKKINDLACQEEIIHNTGDKSLSPEKETLINHTDDISILDEKMIQTNNQFDSTEIMSRTSSSKFNICKKSAKQRTSTNQRDKNSMKRKKENSTDSLYGNECKVKIIKIKTRSNKKKFKRKREVQADILNHKNGTNTRNTSKLNKFLDQENPVDTRLENLPGEEVEQNSSDRRKNKCNFPVWSQCGRCQLQFNSYSEHATHMRDVHRPYPCQLCEWVGHKRHLLASHMYGQHKIVAYPELYPLVECDAEGCNFKCLGINMHEHKRCHLYKTDQLVCDGCGMKFKSIGGLRRHSLKHNNEEMKYQCKECGKVFGWQNHLTNHMFNVHSTEKLCHLCPFKTKSNTTLNIHLHNKHGEPIPENQTVGFHASFAEDELHLL